MGLLSWLFGPTEKSNAEKQADGIVEEMSKAKGRPVTGKDIYDLGANTYDRGGDAEDNPFPYGTNAFGMWESGFEDQIYLEDGLQGLDDYYR